MAQLWLWIGAISMTLGAVLFGMKAQAAKSERWRLLLILNFFIAAIAAGLYLAMAMGQGKGLFFDRQTFWIRYVTWSLSTPLLLLVLTYLGKTRLSTTASLLGANAYMLVAGFAATVSPRPINYIWYLVSCGAYLAVLYLLLRPYRLEAVQRYVNGRRLFTRLLTVHVTLWTGYPIVWILANTGFGVLNSGFEAMFYTLLDIAAKVGFGLLSINTLRQLEGADRFHPETVESSAMPHL